MQTSWLAFGICTTVASATAACELEQVDGRNLTVEDFKKMYRAGGKNVLGKPVVLTNLMDLWKLREQDWSIERFASVFGDVALDFDDVNPAVSRYEQFNSTTIGSSLLSPDASRQAVWFMRAQHELSQRLEPLMSIPEPLSAVQLVGPQVSIGLEGHGGEFNMHMENWLAQVAGRKRWMLQEKNAPRPAWSGDESTTRSIHPCAYSENQRQLRPSQRKRTPVFECELAQGDIIYVPDQWAHATCNVGTGLNLALGFIGSVDHLPPPHLAAMTGKLLLLKNLTEGELSMVDRDSGQQPMHLAAASGRPTTIDLLVSRRAQVNVRDHEGMTPVHSAAMFGHKESILALAAARAAVNAVAGGGSQPIAIAAHDGHAKAVQSLLAARARVDGKTKSRKAQRPILRSIPYGHIPTASLLISARATLEPPALHQASQEGHVDLVELFLKQRADVTAEMEGRQALHVSLVTSASKDVIKALLAAGADPYATSRYGETGMYLAQNRGEEYEELLALSAGPSNLSLLLIVCLALAVGIVLALVISKFVLKPKSA